MKVRIDGGRFCSERPAQGDYSMHIHSDSHEIYCFHFGDAEFSVEGNRYPLEPGDLMLLRKGEVHRLILRSDARYERSVINFDLPPEMDPDGRLLAPFNQRPLGKTTATALPSFRTSTGPFIWRRLKRRRSLSGNGAICCRCSAIFTTALSG